MFQFANLPKKHFSQANGLRSTKRHFLAKSWIYTVISYDFESWLRGHFAKIKYGTDSHQWKNNSEPLSTSMFSKFNGVITEWSFLCQVWTGP